MIDLGTGAFAWDDYGFGVRRDAKYTVNEIYSTSLKYRPAQELMARTPHVVTDWKFYNSYVWAPWTRANTKTATAMQTRCGMETIPNHSDEIFTNYVGSGSDYLTKWESYIPVSDRLLVLRKAFHDIRHLRLLDLGCGGGNHLLELAGHGIIVTGMEAHPTMFANRNYLLWERILHGDVLCDTHMFMPEAFDVVILSCIGNVWWSDIVPVLSDVKRVLAPRGVLLMDVKQHVHNDVRAQAVYRESLRNAGLALRYRMESMLIAGKAPTWQG